MGINKMEEILGALQMAQAGVEDAGVNVMLASQRASSVGMRDPDMCEVALQLANIAARLRLYRRRYSARLN